MEDNVKCLEWSPDAKRLARLDEVSAIAFGFPTDLLHTKNVRDFLHGGVSERIQTFRQKSDQAPI